jgi:TPR repeat protein
VSNSYSHLGVIYHNMNAYDQALAWYQKAYDIDSKPNAENFSFAGDLLRIGATHYWMGHWRDAVSEHQRALAMFERFRPTGTPNRSALLTYLCDESVALELHEQARKYCPEGLKVAQDSYGADHQQYATALIRAVSAQILDGQLDTVTVDLTHAREILARAPGDQGRIIKSALLTESSIAYARHDYGMLRELLRTLIGSGEKTNQRAPRAFAWFALACTKAHGDGCTDDAVAQAEQVLADARFTHHPYQLPAQIALAEIEIANSRPQAAVDRVEAALALALPEIGEQHSWVGQAHAMLAEAQTALGNPGRAAREQKLADAIVDAQPPGHPLRLWISNARRS